MGKWTAQFQSLLNLFLKSNCPLCDRPANNILCRSCQQQLQKCQQPNPAQRWEKPLPVFVWGKYEGSLKRAIAAMKYNNHPQLAKPLGHWLGEAWHHSPVSGAAPKLSVIPIPLHAAKFKERGFNQAELIAQHFCEWTNLTFQPHGLERIRNTKPQFGLSRREREANLAGAFQLGSAFRQRLPQGSVLLLDDIYTSGTTVRAAVQALQLRQVPVYGVVAIASPPQQT